MIKGQRKWLPGVAAAMLAACVMPVSAATETAGEKTGSMLAVYGMLALFSLVLLAVYVLGEKNKERKFILLYSCVAAVNCGYFLQAVSRTLPGALMANRLSYLGAAFSILLMLLIILDVCRVPCKKWMRIALIAVSTAAFLLAASGGWLGLYYSDVSIETVNGVTKLVKTYGPLHIIYGVYLFAYFALMVASVIYGAARKKLTSAKYAVFLGAVVLGNICIWLVEQIIDVDFEFLSVSYIATEVLLLLLCSMLRDYGILQQRGQMLALCQLKAPAEESAGGKLPRQMEDLFDSFAQKVQTLTTAEKRILDYYIQGYEIAQIPDLAFISIHTVKKHNRSIYQKLSVASRDELMLYIELFRRCGRLEELTEEV